MMQKPTKQYILWVSNGPGGYVPTEFDTVVEALVAEKYSSDWYLTEAINDLSAYGSFRKAKEPKHEN